jgi:eukaryotic-like serine/threonine-protein kinase
MSNPVPTKIGKYDVIRVIGRGGMGVVYEALDPHLGRRVAIKTITGIFADNPDMLKRFTREAQSLGSLQHPNIVTVYDLGAHEGNPYLVMEYLEGESLDAALSSRRQLSLLEKITLVIQVCHGLSYVHRRDVIHRDIKPANIMMCKEGGVKIFDFGIAHAGDQNVTGTGELIGTLKYMAPEQVNSRTSDARVDIFSTGVVLYQLITSHLPFEGENTAATILKIVHEPPPPLRTYLSAFPPEIEPILLRSMAKNPDDRYSSADEFALDLEHLLGQLKEELVSREMQGVASLLDRGDVHEARRLLLRVLTVDHQHSSAISQLREVQKRIHRGEIENKILELRQLAEMALEGHQFEQAQAHVDRALTLDRDDPGLKQLREAILAEASREEKVYAALNAAQAAQAEGNLDAAKKAAAEALALKPEDTQAKVLYRLISQEIEEHSQQNQVEGYLKEASQEISSQRFTVALEILKRAQQLDPAAPQLHSLIAAAVAGHEQERRLKGIQTSVREIEYALNRGDYRSAGEKTNEALARFPEDRNLLQLKALADRQRLRRENKQFDDEQSDAAPQGFETARTGELDEEPENIASLSGPELQVASPAMQTGSAERLPSPAQPEIGSDGLNEEKLRIIERQLATFIGPLARLLVKRASAKTSSTLELYAVLAADLEREDDRKAFLARRAELDTGHAKVPSRQVSAEAAPAPALPLAASASSEITPAAIERAAHLLAAHLGPIASVLARKEAKRAANLRSFYELLAAHVAEPAERERFLKVAGIQNDSAIKSSITPT